MKWRSGRSARSPAAILVGSRIEVARRARDLTLQQVADHLGVSNQLVSQWESGIGKVPIYELAELLHVSVEFLERGNSELQARLQRKTDNRELGLVAARDEEKRRLAAEGKAQRKLAAAEREAQLARSRAAEELAARVQLCFVCSKRRGDWVLYDKFLCRQCREE